MAAAQLVVLGLVLLGVERGFGAGNISTSMLDVGSKTRLTCTLDSSDTAILGHRWMKGDKVLQEDSEADLTTQFEVDTLESPGQYSCTFLSKPTDRTASVNVKGPPKIKAVKKSEHATEGETVVLACKSESFPPVTQWVFNNVSKNKLVVSSETKTELHIQNLVLEADPGVYACNGTNTEGTDQAVITLRVRNRLAALWPFLGIVAEVLVLVTIIFIYEKRRKPDQVLDDEDMGSAPLKSSGNMNDKDKNVRQRNAN
uniref:Basigin n=1 Tax=Pipistrellus kuhlii TaxID=59472 RepID=A0A7J7X919_PIPKU|nr:basigin (Ok blood group) [Pipistrellus kuhlii]